MTAAGEAFYYVRAGGRQRRGRQERTRARQGIAMPALPTGKCCRCGQGHGAGKGPCWACREAAAEEARALLPVVGGLMMSDAGLLVAWQDLLILPYRL
jgi:hypothetical protein